ncbi:transposable element Tcb1 transposase [Trichonephila clavipes]|nr:transposable element Tcb1 transposase [Trichonephila clavipes]
MLQELGNPFWANEAPRKAAVVHFRLLTGHDFESDQAIEEPAEIMNINQDSEKRSVTSRRKQQSAFDQVSEFDRGRIVAYRDCGLSFRKIGSRVGRNQTTEMWICDRWMKEGTTDRRDRSHPPQCTTSREDRQIVRMAVTDPSVTSRTVAQHIVSVTHRSVSARTIRCRLQQSGLSTRRPLLGLHLTQNHRRFRRQWCDERRMWAVEWNEVVFTDESRICLQHHDGRIRVWRHRGQRMLNSCVMHLHTGPAPGIMVWGGIGYHSRTSLVRYFKQQALHLRGVGVSCSSLPSGLGHSNISTG